MDPAGGLCEILADPEKQNRGDNRKLAGDDEQGVSPLAALVEEFDLVGGEVALFGGKKGIGHQVCLLRRPLPAMWRWAHCFDSIT